MQHERQRRPGVEPAWRQKRRIGRREKGVTAAVVLTVGLAAGVARRQDPPEPIPALLPPAAAVPAAVLPGLASPLAAAPAFEPVDAGRAGLDPERLADAEQAVRREVRRGAFPGGALVVGRGERVVTMRGIGRTSWDGEEVDPRRTVYDLASLTKVVATTTAVMLLVEDGRMDLDAPVARYLPDFGGGAKSRVTVRHLLTHTSGLPAWADLGDDSPERALRRAVGMELERAPGQRVEYSDIGFAVLWAAAERAAGEPLPGMLQRRVFRPLGMTSTGFRPALPCEECAPTHRRRDGSELRGEVHDPVARQLGGVAGNAGLFSTAEDLGRFAAMLAGGGELEGVRVLEAETVREFTTRQPGAGTRALGWDTPGEGGGSAGRRISGSAFGHTGFTGTSLWVDPERGTWTVLLSNRTYRPKASNRIQALRRGVHDRVAAAVEGVAAE